MMRHAQTDKVSPRVVGWIAVDVMPLGGILVTSANLTFLWEFELCRVVISHATSTLGLLGVIPIGLRTWPTLVFLRIVSVAFTPRRTWTTIAISVVFVTATLTTGYTFLSTSQQVYARMLLSIPTKVGFAATTTPPKTIM
jgi:hypothetical protein